MSMAGAGRARDDAQGPGDGRRERRPRHGRRARRLRHAVDDPGPRGRAARDSSTTSLLAGADTSDGGAGVVPAGVAALLGLPYLSYAAKIEPDPAAGRVRVHRISPTGYDVLEAPMPALVVATQALGEPRYPSLKGIMAARSKTIATRVAGRPARGGDGCRSAARSRRRP